MKVYEGLESFHAVKHAVVTIGTFDGVHLGHQKILKRVQQLAASSDKETVIITFWPHPRLVLYPDEHNIQLLSTFEEKVSLLTAFGIDHLVTIPFTKEFSQLSSEGFIQKILIEKLKTRILVIGYDHRFGKNREGSFEYLKQNRHRYGFEIEEIPREDIDQVGISSTKIRKALEAGDFKVANGFLGRNYSFTGTIVEGERIGRSMGFPTANVQLDNDYKLIPKDGAYAVYVQLGNRTWGGMLNIGKRPTLDGIKKTIEVNLFDFSGNLYGKQITVLLVEFLRPEKKFANLDELSRQLNKDKEKAILLLSKNTGPE